MTTPREHHIKLRLAAAWIAAISVDNTYAAQTSKCQPETERIKNIIITFADHDIEYLPGGGYDTIKLERILSSNLGRRFDEDCLKYLMSSLESKWYLKMADGVSLFSDDDNRPLQYGFFITNEGDIVRPYVKSK